MDDEARLERFVNVATAMAVAVLASLSFAALRSGKIDHLFHGRAPGGIAGPAWIIFAGVVILMTVIVGQGLFAKVPRGRREPLLVGMGVAAVVPTMWALLLA